MATTHWAFAKKNKGNEFNQMQKRIPFYSYADKRIAILTDKRFCVELRSELVRSKILFSDALDWVIKANIDDKQISRVKDEFDILLDEIEIKPNKWDERIPGEFLEKVMEYDWELVQKSIALFDDLDVLIKDLYKAVEERKIDKPMLSKLSIEMDVVNEKVDDIAIMFREREAAFEIRTLGYKDAFGRIKERIRKAI